MARSAEKKAYVIDYDNKTVTVDESIKRTKSDNEMIQILVTGGYQLKIKSQLRKEKSSKWTEAKILELFNEFESKCPHQKIKVKDQTEDWTIQQVKAKYEDIKLKGKDGKDTPTLTQKNESPKGRHFISARVWFENSVYPDINEKIIEANKASSNEPNIEE